MHEWTVLHRRFEVGEIVTYNGEECEIHSYDCPMDMYTVMFDGDYRLVSPFDIEPVLDVRVKLNDLVKE